MQAKSKKPAKNEIKVPTLHLTITRGIPALRQMAEQAMKKGVLKEELTPSEYAQLIGGYIHDMTGGLRAAVFVANFAIEAGKDKETKELLAKKYAPQTVSDLFNAGRNIIPALREIGALDYRDPHNLRNVGKVLKNKKSPAYKAVVKAIKENKPVTMVRQARAIVEGKTHPKPVKKVAPLTESAARKAIRDACAALGAIIGGSKVVTYLYGIVTEIEGIKPQASALQAA